MAPCSPGLVLSWVFLSTASLSLPQGPCTYQDCCATQVHGAMPFLPSDLYSEASLRCPPWLHLAFIGFLRSSHSGRISFVWPTSTAAGASLSCSRPHCQLLVQGLCPAKPTGWKNMSHTTGLRTWVYRAAKLVFLGLPHSLKLLAPFWLGSRVACPPLLTWGNCCSRSESCPVGIPSSPL